MITECIQHPLIYRPDNLNDDKFQILMIHLDQIIRNGILIIDDNSQFIKILNEYIANLEGSKKVELIQAFNSLKSRNRIIKLSTANINLQKQCKQGYCSQFYSLMNKYPNSCIVTSECNNELKGNMEYEICSLSNYSKSELYRKLKATSKSVPNNTSIKYFKEEIIEPLIVSVKDLVSRY